MPQCPFCSGTGKRAGFINARPQHYYGAIKCPSCEGTGEIDGGYAKRYEYSKVLNEIRRAKMITTRDIAESLNLTMYEVSNMLSGRVAPSPELLNLLGIEKEE